MVNACNSKPDQPAIPQLPDIGITIDEINTRIAIRAPDGINSFRTNSVVYLEIKLISSSSKDEVAFNSDFGARLFIVQGGQWVEIKNSAIYVAGNGYLFLSPGGGPMQSYVSGVKPDLPNVNSTIIVRMVITGYIVKNAQVTDEKTGAYVDVKLNP